MAVSQNGWRVVPQDAVTDRAVYGVEFPNGWLKGDVDTVFTYLIDRLHHTVEPLKTGTCWGWFVKKIEGSKTISNHASGTAIDYNADKHPMGVRNTYSTSDQAKIRTILKDLNGVVRWGGDYTGRPDDMHFEINKGASAVRAVADKIKRGELITVLSKDDKEWITAQIKAGAKAAAEAVWAATRDIGAAAGTAKDVAELSDVLAHVPGEHTRQETLLKDIKALLAAKKA